MLLASKKRVTCEKAQTAITIIHNAMFWHAMAQYVSFTVSSMVQSDSCVGKPHTLPDLRVLAQSIDVHYWECKSELNRQTFVTGHTTSIISAPTSSMMPSNSEPTSDSESISESISDSESISESISDSESISESISDSGHPDPSSDLPDPHSFISKNPEDSDSDAAEPAFKLGPDGKLSAVERQRRFDLDLCLVYGLAGHKVRDCPKSSRF